MKYSELSKFVEILTKVNEMVKEVVQDETETLDFEVFENSITFKLSDYDLFNKMLQEFGESNEYNEFYSRHERDGTVTVRFSLNK